MSGMTSERLAEILALQRIDITTGDTWSHMWQAFGAVDALLAHVDHLTAENTRLRKGIVEALDLARLLPEQLECGGDSCHCTACDLVCELGNLLDPPTEGETDHE